MNIKSFNRTAYGACAQPGLRQFGAPCSGKRIITEETRREMRAILREIQSGVFARDFILENKANMASFKSMRRIQAEHPIEQVGIKLRALMPWLNKK